MWDKPRNMDEDFTPPRIAATDIQAEKLASFMLMANAFFAIAAFQSVP
jgi:hypothetical protein